MKRRVVDSRDNQIVINFGLINKNCVHRDKNVSKLKWLLLIFGIGLLWYFYKYEKK